MMKRVLAIAIALALLSLYACGQAEPEEASAATTIVTTAEATTTQEQATEASPERRGNSINNINSGGQVAYDDGWVFIAEPRYDCRLDKMREDGSERVTLFDGYVSHINALDGWLYFANMVDWGRQGPHEIHKMRYDGSQAQLLRVVEHGTPKMLVVDNWIYFRTSSDPSSTGIGRMDVNGEQFMLYNQVAVDHHHIADVTGGWLYYTSGGNGTWPVFRLRIDGTGKPEQLTMLESPLHAGASFTIAGDWMYFANAERMQLERSRLNGEDRSVILRLEDQQSRVGVLQVADDWLFIEFADRDHMTAAKIRLNGSALTRLDRYFFNPIFAGSWIYYLGGEMGFAFHRVDLDGNGEEAFWDEGIDEYPEY